MACGYNGVPCPPPPPHCDQVIPNQCGNLPLTGPVWLDQLVLILIVLGLLAVIVWSFTAWDRSTR